jgi:hypothetical protein
LAINYTDGKLFYKDNNAAIQVIGWKTTPTTAGGTGLTSYTAGDLPYYSSGSALSKLGIGTSGYVLESNGSVPTWVAQSTLSVGSATNATNTAITDNTSSSATWYPTIVSATTGNLPQTTSSTKLSFVPSTGTLTATNYAGTWAGSTIGTGYGGTGLTSFTANGVVYASSSNVLATSSAFTFNGTNVGFTGNLVQGTTAKGINFTANTPASGMTSQLLNWYEQGTWTPAFTSSSGTITTTAANSTYTKIGNLVRCTFNLTVNSVSSPSGSLNLTGLPFTTSATAYGTVSVHFWGGLNSPVSYISGYTLLNSTICNMTSVNGSAVGVDNTTNPNILKAGSSISGFVLYESA